MNEIATYRTSLLQALAIARRIQLGDTKAKEELEEYLQKENYRLTRVMCILYWIGRDSTAILPDSTYDYDRTCECYEQTEWEAEREKYIEYLLNNHCVYTCILTGLDKLEENIFVDL